MKKNRLTNFKLISNKQLESIYGGFAWIPFIQWTIFGFLGLKILTSYKGNAKLDGLGSVNFENLDDKNVNQTKIIYYPF